MSLGELSRQNVEAVERDLEALPDELARGALAATALTMAAILDDPRASGTSKSMCAGRLLDTMRELRELSPPKEKRDRIDVIADDLAARRARIAAGSPATADTPRP